MICPADEEKRTNFALRFGLALLGAFNEIQIANVPVFAEKKKGNERTQHRNATPLPFVSLMPPMCPDGIGVTRVILVSTSAGRRM